MHCLKELLKSREDKLINSHVRRVDSHVLLDTCSSRTLKQLESTLTSSLLQLTVNNLVAGPAAQVAEHSSIGSLVAHVSVVDADSGNSGVTSCFIDDSRQFALEQIEGLAQYKLTSNAQLDREQTSEYRVTVTCRDFGEPSLSAAQVVIIDVTDMNHHAPVCEEPFAVEVQENGGIGGYFCFLCDLGIQELYI